MSDEDDEPFVGGPPPDPSERTWRHPSELAAQANADAMAAARRGSDRSTRPLGSLWPRSNRPLSIILAGSLGAAACLTAVAVLQFNDPGSTTFDAAAIGPTGAIDIPPVDEDQLTPLDPEIIGVSTTAADSAPTTAPASTTIPSDAVMHAANDHVVGVMVDGEQVASGIAMEGFVLTSASRVGDELSVSVRSNGSADTSIAYLIGVDSFSDLAVYRPSLETRRLDAWSVISIQAQELEIDSGDAWTPTAPRVVHPGDAVVVASASGDTMAVSSGNVIGLDGECQTPDKHPVVGVIDTTVRHPEASAGGLLVSSTGTPIGIVVNSTSSLVSAVPIGDALQIADRLTEQGWASDAWIGFVGIDLDRGVEVIDVTAEGPADLAGIQPGDVIAFFDGSQIDHMGSVTAGLRRAEPGDVIVIVVERNGEYVSLRVTVQAYQLDVRISEPVGG